MYKVSRVCETGRKRPSFQYDSVLYPGLTYTFNVKVMMPNNKIKLECKACRYQKKHSGGVNPIIFMANNRFFKDPDALKHLCIPNGATRDDATIRPPAIRELIRPTKRKIKKKKPVFPSPSTIPEASGTFTSTIDEDSFTYSFKLTGFKPNELDIRVDDQEMYVTAQSSENFDLQPSEETESEPALKNFSEVITLPEGYKKDSMRSLFHGNGELVIYGEYDNAEANNDVLMEMQMTESRDSTVEENDYNENEALSPETLLKELKNFL